MFYSVYSKNEEIFEDERFIALGRLGDKIVELQSNEMIPMPKGASLISMPKRVPVGISRLTGNFALIEDRGEAVAALLPQGYTRTALPAAIKERNEGYLPLFGYTAVAWNNEKEEFYVAAIKTDDSSKKWAPNEYNTGELEHLVNKSLLMYKKNPIIKQLAYCALNYSCFTAQNMFYQRWEAGVPVSSLCNADCVGCISLQSSELCPSPQKRITYTPSVEEIVEVAKAHLENADEAIISFGQGCEGEPLIRSEIISKAIKEIRKQTNKGIINANTNAGYTKGVLEVSSAGIDSLRISINSAIEEHYNAYFRPKSYVFDDVLASIKEAKKNGVFVSLNWLSLPGVSDTRKEVKAMIDLVKKYSIDMIQIRNLNLDPDMYQTIYPEALQEDSLGVIRMIEILKQELPGISLGNFSKSII